MVVYLGCDLRSVGNNGAAGSGFFSGDMIEADFLSLGTPPANIAAMLNIPGGPPPGLAVGAGAGRSSATTLRNVLPA